MATCQAVADVLDETIEALTEFDLDRLQILEERIASVAQSNLVVDEGGMNTVLEKKRVLGMVLHCSASNLNALNRLYGRNMRDPWER